ncbi:uncharacterized protein EDB93DRAFT_90712 [Suillus bovinus]|uniref:uncharacterized protein n=1 Tax=Suillus bovinus TaxID=48563 RepID=UPI001B8760F2|nr:uncharacterized protein EDB93DRAFT_90712 [Suillus bovinus]KAG2155208.1 hypothetical protein EDB93DRAFT_90712 [Suillus bovinus]
MLLNEDPTANRLRVPAAPAFIPSSKPRVRICHQCGLVLPQDFPWIVCDDCQLPPLRTRGIPSPAHTLPVNQDATALGQAAQSFSICALCQMTVEGSRTTSTSYILCTACRTRQEGMKLKPTRHINQNVPPLLSPTSLVIAPSHDLPRPCFFNSRGEIVAPSPVPVTVAPMRLCMRFGCGAQLAPNQLLNFCDVCLRSGFGRGAPAPPPALKQLPKRMRRDELLSGVLISKAKRDIDAAQRAEALEQPRKETLAELGPRNNDDLDLELTYPE